MGLSKSKYTRGLQCHKSLWLYQHRPELRSEPDASALARFAVGDQVGQLAQQLFPGGREIQFDPQNFEGMIETTSEWIADGLTTIYEASFSEDGVFVACDILHKGDLGWELYEVKTTTKVKPYHLDDIAVQWFVLNKAGIKPAKAHLVHINNKYQRENQLDLHGLFKIEDVTDEVLLKQAAIPANLSSMQQMIEGEQPDIPIGVHCANPFECDFKAICWQDVPTPSVLDLYQMNGHKKFALYHSGSRTFDQIEPQTKLSLTQQKQVDAWLQDRVFIDEDIIQTFLNQLTGPLYFLDFETFQAAIPRFVGQRSYDQVPFQYSLHIEESHGLTHREFLAESSEDPRRALAEQLLVDLGTNGSIIAFNMSFEKSVIGKLAECFPDLKKDLGLLQDRFVDLIVPFKQGGYYHKAMNGSFSIKSILPALFPDDPELSYKSLTIANGSAASAIYAGLHEIKEKEKVEMIRKDLLAYCKLDTLAMVKILGFLRSLLRA